VMAVLDGHHDVADSGDPVGGAIAKIVRALPEPIAAQVEAIRRTTAPAPDRSAARPDPGITTTLVQACSNRRRVRIDYRSEAGSEWVTDVEPWAVVVRHGRWYLLCLSKGRRRTYRVDRVREAEPLDEPFSPPADLDPVAVLEEHLAAGWEYEVEVVIEGPFEAVAWRLPRTLGRLEPGDDGTTRLVGTTSNPSQYAEQLAVLPVQYRIVRGRELRDAARTIGQRLLAASSDSAAAAAPGVGVGAGAGAEP